MNRHHDYLSALISIGIGTAAFLILTTLATYGPLDGEYVDVALFAAFMLSANLAAAYAARAPDAAGCYPSTRRSTPTSASTADGCVAQLVAKRMTVWDSSGFSQKQYTTCLRSSGSTASSTTANTWFVGAS